MTRILKVCIAGCAIRMCRFTDLLLVTLSIDFSENALMDDLRTGTVNDFANLEEDDGSYERALRNSQIISLFQGVDYGRYSQMHKVYIYIQLFYPTTTRQAIDVLRCDRKSYRLEYLYGVSHQLTQKFAYGMGYNPFDDFKAFGSFPQSHTCSPFWRTIVVSQFM